MPRKQLSAPRSPKKTASNSQPLATAAMARSIKRAQNMIDALLLELARGVKDPVWRDSPDWKALFGNKQTVAMHLHKLIQALASLPEFASASHSREGAAPDETMTSAELKILEDWLRETNAPSVTGATDL